jgi:hypothetical protein
MPSAKQGTSMIYVATLYAVIDGEKRNFDTETFEAKSVEEAKRKAMEWAAFSVAMIDRPVHFQVIDAEGWEIYHKAFGEL